MGFNFRLKRVLKIREIKQNQRAAELGGAIQSLEREKTVHEGLEHEYTSSGDGKTSSMAEMQVQATRRTWLTEALTEQAENIDKARVAVEEATTEYTEAAKETNVLEKLEEKQFEEYRLDLVREDKKLMSEVAIRRSRK